MQKKATLSIVLAAALTLPLVLPAHAVTGFGFIRIQNLDGLREMLVVSGFDCRPALRPDQTEDATLATESISCSGPRRARHQIPGYAR